MAHEIESNKAFYTRTPAWHGLGKTLSDAPSAYDAWQIAYPHTLLELDLKGVLGEHSVDVNTHKLIIRDDGVQLGVVGSSFEVLQPSEIFNYFNPFIESGLIELDSGGSLRNGKRMWALGRIKGANADIKINDTVSAYLLMYTGFDGSLSLGMSFTAIRVVCANTLKMAIADKSADQLRFKHTKNLRIKADQALSTIDLATRSFGNTVDQYRHLDTIKCSDDDFQQYLFKLFLNRQEQQDMSKVSAKKSNILERITEIYDTNTVDTGTAWGAYNAVTEYLTHEYGHSDDSRVNASWFGVNNALNAQALEHAMAIN